MKRKDDMATLRKGIILRFAAVMMIIISIQSNIDYSFGEYMKQNAEPEEWTLLVPVLAAVLTYLLGGYVFYLLIQKLLKKESDRRMGEQNLIYAAIAHDLKTPMTSVQGFAKALSEGKIHFDEQQEIFDIIYRKSNSMNDMVETLSEYAKLGASNYKLSLSDVDICVLVRDIIADHYNEFEEKEQALDIDIPETPVIVNADERELRRALTNLILNASKHNPRGIRVKASVRSENEKAVVKIADSGEPLPEGMEIFEPFVTENTARTTGRGTGLGLAITKRVIERHGGEISTEACDEGYTKAFVVRLQRYPLGAVPEIQAKRFARRYSGKKSGCGAGLL